MTQGRQSGTVESCTVVARLLPREEDLWRDCGRDSDYEALRNHMVFVQEGSFSKDVPVSAVNVGDKLVVANGDSVSTEVRKIERVTRQGAFAPFTKTGTIVVSVPHGRESILHAMDGSRLQRPSPHGLRSQLRDLRERNLYQRHLQLGL